MATPRRVSHPVCFLAQGELYHGFLLMNDLFQKFFVKVLKNLKKVKRVQIYMDDPVYIVNSEKNLIVSSTF